MTFLFPSQSSNTRSSVSHAHRWASIDRSRSTDHQVPREAAVELPAGAAFAKACSISSLIMPVTLFHGEEANGLRAPGVQSKMALGVQSVA